jgi:hypothetical protein
VAGVRTEALQAVGLRRRDARTGAVRTIPNGVAAARRAPCLVGVDTLAAGTKADRNPEPRPTAAAPHRNLNGEASSQWVLVVNDSIPPLATVQAESAAAPR